MPTVNQLIRKGRQDKKKKSKSPAFGKSGETLSLFGLTTLTAEQATALAEFGARLSSFPDWGIFLMM